MNELATKSLKKKSFKNFTSKYAIYIVLVVLFFSIGILDSSFLSMGNITNVLIISSVRIIIALGVGGALITRGTDLSAGRTVGLTACIAASLLQKPDYAMACLVVVVLEEVMIAGSASLIEPVTMRCGRSVLALLSTKMF